MKYLVSGGGGFVGKALVKALLERGDQVLSIARGDYPELVQLGAQTLKFDLGKGKAESLSQKVREHGFADSVTFFHVASHVRMWGEYGAFYDSNVIGTRNAIETCRALGIPKLVFTSSPSVITDGSDLKGVDETYPYPERHIAYYPKTKAIAEREVLAANDESLYTCALRPHLIFGPGDVNLAPTIIRKAQAGQLVQVGPGKNLVDFSYIDDCIQAHLLADRALSNNAACRGEAFFISQGDPVPLWDWISRLLVKYEMPPLKREISPRVAYFAAWILEQFSRVTGKEPRLTRFLIKEMATDHYFNIEKARRLLGYKPTIGVFSALEKTPIEEIGSI